MGETTANKSPISENDVKKVKFRFNFIVSYNDNNDDGNLGAAHTQSHLIVMSPLIAETAQAVHTQSQSHGDSPITGEGEAWESADGASPFTAETGDAGYTQNPAHEQSPLIGETADNCGQNCPSVPCESSQSVNVDTMSGNVSELWKSGRKRENNENKNATDPKCMSAVRNLTSPLSEVGFGDSNSHMNINLNITNIFDGDDDILVAFGDNIEKDMEGIKSIIKEDEDILYASGCAPHTQLTKWTWS